MRKEIIKDNFSDITDFCFSSLGFIQIVTKAGTTELNDPDFIETDFRYTQKKLEFSSPSILNELDGDDKEMINSEGFGGIEKYLTTLFPTLMVRGSIDASLEYFSTSIDLLGNETYCLFIPEGFSEVTGYEGSEAVIRVTFDDSEIEFSKILYIITTYDGENPKKVNLSLTAYQGDKDPVRKMSEYVLRNDAFVKNYEGCREENEYLYSSISSSLIGTEKLGERPVYNLLKGFMSTGWKRSRRYSVGDRVVVGGKTYQSLESDNIGNHPYYSRMWSIVYDN